VEVGSNPVQVDSLTAEFSNGGVWDSSAYATTKLPKIKDGAAAIHALYVSEGLLLSPSCGLSQFIEKAKAFAARWTADPAAPVPPTDIFALLHMQRLIEAILPLDGHADRRKYLKRLMAGEVIFLSA
jgi:hypothetical protein